MDDPDRKIKGRLTISALRKSSSPSVLPPSYNQRDLQRLHNRATQLIASASGAHTSPIGQRNTINNSNRTTAAGRNYRRDPLITPAAPTSSSSSSNSSSFQTPNVLSAPPSSVVLNNLQQVVDDMRDLMRQSLLERKRIHADALELAEAESRDLYDSVIAAQTRANNAEEELEKANIKLREYRDNTANKFSNELSELKKDWSNQMSASIIQNELRSALDKTKSIAEEQVIRLKVLTEERSRMIQENTLIRRNLKEIKDKNAEKINILKKEYNDEKMVLTDKIQSMEDIIKNQSNNIDTLKDQNNTMNLELHDLQHKFKINTTNLTQCNQELEECQKKLKKEKEININMNVKLKETTNQLMVKVNTLTSSNNELKQNLKHTTIRLEEIKKDRNKERESMENIMNDLKSSTSTATEILIDDACSKAVKEKEALLKDRFNKDIELIKEELKDTQSKYDTLKREHLSVTRDLKLKEEQYNELDERNNENERKLHHYDSVLIVDKNVEINRLKSSIKNLKMHHEKDLGTMKMNHSLLLTSKVDEAATSARREEEERTRNVVDEMNRRMNDNNLKLQKLMQSTSIHESEKNRAIMEKERLEKLLKDSKSEIEENQRAVLETLKLSSEIQANENHLKMVLNNEKEHAFTLKNDYDTIVSKFNRLENDHNTLQHQYDEMKVEYT